MDKGKIDNFFVYPNPTSNTISVNSSQFIQEMQLLDVAGKLILTVSSANTADLSSISSGIYFLAIQFENGDTGHVKILKK